MLIEEAKDFETIDYVYVVDENEVLIGVARHLRKYKSKLERVVARERFGLSSAGPKPAMLDHYTTGLRQSWG